MEGNGYRRIDSMNRLEVLLFKFLRSELWGEGFDMKLSPQEGTEVLGLAAEQTVFGLVFNAMVTNQVQLDRDALFHAIALQSKIRQQNELVNQNMADFLRRMTSGQVEYVVIKGQSIGALYPHPEMRMSGDVDFWIKDRYENTKEKIEAIIGVALPDLSKYEKDGSFDLNGVLYEVHSYLITFGSKKSSKYWDRIAFDSWKQKCYVEILTEKVRVLPPTLNAVYVFLHLFFHFIREGVALRQFCDWAVLLNHYYHEIDVVQLEDILVKLNMLKAYKAFGGILVNYLGLPEDRFPFAISKKSGKWEQRIIRDVFKGGNFGKRNHAAHKVGLKFKLETAAVSIRNVFTYYSLAPRDLRNYLIRLIKGNIVLLVKGKNII